MHRLPLRGGPFDGYELQFEDPVPLIVTLVLPIPRGAPRVQPGEVMDTKAKPARVEADRPSGALLQHAVYMHFAGTGGERYFRWKRG